MSEHLFEHPIKEPWSNYPSLFRPKFFKIIFSLLLIICFAEILLCFFGIPKDAQMTNSGLKTFPVPIALSMAVLFILPIPCLVVGLVLGLIPIRQTPYKIKFRTFFLLALILIESYALKELISATMHG